LEVLEGRRDADDRLGVVACGWGSGANLSLAMAMVPVVVTPPMLCEWRRDGGEDEKFDTIGRAHV